MVLLDTRAAWASRLASSWCPKSVVAPRQDHSTAPDRCPSGCRDAVAAPRPSRRLPSSSPNARRTMSPIESWPPLPSTEPLPSSEPLRSSELSWPGSASAIAPPAPLMSRPEATRHADAAARTRRATSVTTSQIAIWTGHFYGCDDCRTIRCTRLLKGRTTRFTGRPTGGRVAGDSVVLRHRHTRLAEMSTTRQGGGRDGPVHTTQKPRYSAS